jgi:uncharacterized NAD-dependent epimerase/dehydratase family protein
VNTPRKMRRYAVLAPGCFTGRAAKTAHGVIAYGREPVVAVIDPALAGRRVCDVLPHLNKDIPIVADLEATFEYKPNALLVGVAPPGGALPDEWREYILAALRAGLEVVSGLHEILSDDADFAEAAYTGGTSIWDVRLPPAPRLFTGAAWNVKPFVLLTVGSDCSVGKMTVSLELIKAACERKRDPEFIATGQTGVMIAGKGIAIDRVISDFASGAVESLVTSAEADTDLLIVEGQGAINHAAFAPVTMALLYGAAPDALLLVHDVSRHDIEPLGSPILPLPILVKLYEALTAVVKPAPVIGIALNTSSLNDEDARTVIDGVRKETGLPADDVIRFGPQGLFDAIAPALTEKTKAVKRSV